MGSSNRGLAFESKIKGNLGMYELDDQIQGLIYLSTGKTPTCIIDEKYWKEVDAPYFDLDRISIFGSSYGNTIFQKNNLFLGGYLALRAISTYPFIFNKAFCSSLVVDWRAYDSAYTERYLGLLSDSYTQSSCLDLKFPIE